MNWNYLLKHWLFTILIGPIVSQIMVYSSDLNPNEIGELLEVYLILALFGLIFSIPTYVFCSLVYFILAKNKAPKMISKIILTTFVIIGVISTTNLIKGTMMFDLALSYSISAFIIGIYIKLNFEIENDNDKNHH